MARQQIPILELALGLGVAAYAGVLGQSLKTQIRGIIDPILHPGNTTPTTPPGTPSSGSGGTCAALVEGRVYKGSGPDVYLAERGVVRLIPSADDFQRMGLRWEGVHTISDACLTGYPHGEPARFRAAIPAPPLPS